MKKKVILCCPTVTRPAAPFLEALQASIPILHDAGWEEGSVYEIGCPYIGAARSKMLRKAMDTDADVFVFLDHDLSWAPHDLLRLIKTEGDVVAGTYRFKREPEEYMGYIIPGDKGRPIVRDDGAVLMHSIPAGFLKVTREAVRTFMRRYPGLLYGEPDRYHIDLFNHGAIDGVWYGEDYAFAKRWREAGGHVWCMPNLDLVHHAIGFKDGQTVYTPFAGNYHYWLARCPGGTLDPKREMEKEAA